MSEEYNQLVDILSKQLANNSGSLTKEEYKKNLSKRDLKKLDTFEHLVLANVYNYKEFAFYAIYSEILNPDSVEYFKLKHMYLNQSWYEQIFRGICIECTGNDMLYYDYFSYLTESYVDYLTKEKPKFTIKNIIKGITYLKFLINFG